MSAVFPDGYVLDSVGPYYADGKNNDAGITSHIITLHRDLIDWLDIGDVCILDRSFRDVLDVFEDLGLKPKMPAFLKAGFAQHVAYRKPINHVLLPKYVWLLKRTMAA